MRDTVVGAKKNLCPGYSTIIQSYGHGRPNLTYIDLLKQDTGLEEPDIKIAMLARQKCVEKFLIF